MNYLKSSVILLQFVSVDFSEYGEELKVQFLACESQRNILKVLEKVGSRYEGLPASHPTYTQV